MWQTPKYKRGEECDGRQNTKEEKSVAGAKRHYNRRVWQAPKYITREECGMRQMSSHGKSVAGAKRHHKRRVMWAPKYIRGETSPESMASGHRPEHQAPPEVFYNETEARKYTANTRMISIQQQLSERAVELLALPEDTPCFILDVGCGSGLSGETLTDQGHVWTGVDISSSMLDVALEREVEGDMILGDMGEGMPFRPGTFDGVISISALQWLCNADKSYHNPPKRLYKFFSTLYASMRRGARAVMQLYPENSDQLELITRQSMKAGFTGAQQLPSGLGTPGANPQQTQAAFTTKRERMHKIRGKPPKKSREWILEKKERRRRQGKEVRSDTKYTGRRRPTSF
ncbi:putative 18S rRNA (guanine-N(7))-methyltransferase [Lamellibrachia satsuma]|nr:putative 18S rRNA (guanine-N(7))-methyltransferase [Lamellibrachia satsuma]